MGNRWGTNGEQMGRDGDEEISLQATWDQGGRIKGIKRGSKRESARGDKKARGKRQCMKPKCVHNDCV
jgi:hypothetical protein